MTPDEWYGILQDFLEDHMDEAPDEKCKAFVQELLQMTYEVED